MTTEDVKAADAASTGPPAVVITPPSRWDPYGRDALLRVIRDDLRANSAHGLSGLMKPAARAFIVYRYGQWILAHHGRGRGWQLGEKLYWLLFSAVRNRFGIELVATAEVGRGVRIEHQHGIVIHPFAVIGDGVQIHHGVTIGLKDENELAAIQENVPRIGARVVIGVGATIVGAVSIGDDARVGPHAVVTRDVPPGATVVAAPSRVLRLAEGADDG